MGRVIGLISIKGGVGKTTISAALASNLVRNHGKKVLVVDANYSAPNLGIHMNVTAPNKTIQDVLAGDRISEAIHNVYGVDVIPGNFLNERKINPLKLRSKINKIKSQYDFVILDSSPNINEEIVSTILASDDLFIVSTPDYPTLSCSMKTVQLAKKLNRGITGIILNKVNGNFEVSIDEIQSSTSVPVVAQIKEDEIVRFSLYQRVPAPFFSRDSDFTKEINNISSAFSGKKIKRSFLDWLLFSDYRTEQINREILRQDFYNSVFK